MLAATMAAKKSSAPKPAAKKTAAEKTAAPRPMAAKVSPLKGMPVEQYLSTKVTGWQADVARRLVALVQKAAPDSAVGIKWAQPVFELNGPFAYIKPAKAHLTFGFWRGAELADPKKLLTLGDRMSHVKLTGPEALDEGALGALVKQAVKLNREKGDPTKREK
jgi:hypothetical protein